MPAIFLGLFLAGWMLCGQHLGNLPAYFHSSLEISSGYQDAMGYPCPPIQLYLGFATAGLLAIYLLLNLATAVDRLRGLALFLAASAYLYLNWKHGFIRADGHQIGFYYAALTILAGPPLLLDDGPRWRLPKDLLAAVAGLVSLVAIELVLPGLVRGILSMDSGAIERTVKFTLHPAATHAGYDAAFRNEGEKTKMGAHDRRGRQGFARRAGLRTGRRPLQRLQLPAAPGLPELLGLHALPVAPEPRFLCVRPRARVCDLQAADDRRPPCNDGRSACAASARAALRLPLLGPGLHGLEAQAGPVQRRGVRGRSPSAP